MCKGKGSGPALPPALLRGWARRTGHPANLQAPRVSCCLSMLPMPQPGCSLTLRNESMHLCRHSHLPELWYRVYGPQECLARAARHPQREACAEYMSSQGCWLYTLGLAQVCPAGPGLDAASAALLGRMAEGWRCSLTPARTLPAPFLKPCRRRAFS